MPNRPPGRPKRDPDAPESKALGANLKRLREEQGWTQQQLADASGVPLRSLSDYERGREPYVHAAARLAGALGVTVEDLLGAGGNNLQKNSE